MGEMEIESDSDFKIMAEIKISSRRAISFRDCACEILRNIRQWKPNNFLLLYNKTVFFCACTQIKCHSQRNVCPNDDKKATPMFKF